MSKVSALCVTRCGVHLQRAIDCWSRQTHADRELVIVYDGDPRALCAFRVPPEAVVVYVAERRTLGELRNISIASASGEYLCQWDDDDWFHPDRITRQLETAQASASRACALSRWIEFDTLTGKAYLSNPRCWEGSLLWHRDRTGDGYPALVRGEDTPFARRVNPALLERPDLYVYTCHGDNTWPRSHFEGLFAAAKELPTKVAQAVARKLDRKPAA